MGQAHPRNGYHRCGGGHCFRSSTIHDKHPGKPTKDLQVARCCYPVEVYSLIKSSVQSNNLRRVESAKVSIPPQLRDVVINGDEHRFEWKVDLMSTEKYWQGMKLGLTQDGSRGCQLASCGLRCLRLSLRPKKKG